MAGGLSRALISLGEGVSDLAQMRGQREMEEARAQREENLMRLQQNWRQQEAAQGRIHDKEMFGQRTAAEKEQEAQRFANNKEVAKIENQNAISRQNREEGLTRERWKREDRTNAERYYVGQISNIDTRITSIQDEINKARLSGALVDESALEPMTREIAALQAQRTGMQGRMKDELARMGDPRYKLDPADQEELMARDKGKGGEKSAAQDAKPTGNGTTIKVTDPPRPPPNVQRAERKVVSPEDAKKRAAQSNREIAGGGPGQVGQGARQLKEGARQMGDWIRKKNDQDPRTFQGARQLIDLFN